MTRKCIQLFLLPLLLMWVASPSLAGAPAGGVDSITGTIKSSDGIAMEGVTVTAQAAGASFRVSVFSNADGDYHFPELNAGDYKVWAQSVGYLKAQNAVKVVAGKSQEQNFEMSPTKDYSVQLSGDAWIESLPDDTPEDARLKHIVHNSCTTCHTGNYLLNRRFDEEGWKIAIDAMINIMTRPGANNRALMQAYRDEIAEYLGRVRGENDLMDYTKLPPITGQANDIVVTEYDIPKGDDPNYLQVPDGSDWSLGGPGRGAEALHDVVPGVDGFAYFSDNIYPDRTVGRLDPTTGEITNFVLLDKKGLASRTHAVIPDPKGGIWANNYSDGTIIKLDTDSGEFVTFPKPAGEILAGGHIEMDSKGNLFTSSKSARGGIVKLDPKTGKYTEYLAPTPGGKPYGVAVDRLDNLWMLNLGNDRLMVVDGKTQEVSEVVLPPMKGISPKDLEIGQRVNPKGADGNSAPVYIHGPRRGASDVEGDYIWVALYWSGNLARIDINTKEVKLYPVPSRWSHPYDVHVDKNRTVWVCQHNGDRLSRFDQFTEEFVEYPLPSLGHECRHLFVDDSKNPPEVWIAYSGSAKAARVQFRHDTASSSAKDTP